MMRSSPSMNRRVDAFFLTLQRQANLNIYPIATQQRRQKCSFDFLNDTCVPNDDNKDIGTLNHNNNTNTATRSGNSFGINVESSKVVMSSPWDNMNHLNCSKEFLHKVVTQTIGTNEDGDTQWDVIKKASLKNHGCVLMVFQSTNLRLQDNYPLTLAANKAAELRIPLVCLFVFDGRTFAQPSSVCGFFRRSPQRAQFLIECVELLRHDVEFVHKTPFLVRTGYPEFIIPDICEALNAKAYYTSTQYAPHEKLIEESIKKQLNKTVLSKTTTTIYKENTLSHDGRKSSGTVFHSVWDTTLLHIDDLSIPSIREMKEGEKWFLDELPLTPIRSTLPYNCADGRLLEVVNLVKERIANEFYSSATVSKRETLPLDENGMDHKEMFETIYGDIFDQGDAEPLFEETNEKGSVTLSRKARLRKKLNRKYGKNISSIIDDEGESTSRGTISSVPSCMMPTTRGNNHYKNYSNDTRQVNSRSSESISVRGVIPSLEELGYGSVHKEPFTLDHSTVLFVPFHGGEEAAHDRLEEWLSNDGLLSFAAYSSEKERAVQMYKPNLSRLSPWISHGCISPRTINERLRRECDGKYSRTGMAGKWYQTALMRLGRRDYAHFIGLKYGRSLFFPYGPRPEHTNDIPDWKFDEKIIRRWCSGLTGIPFCDAAMKELTNTGWVGYDGRKALAWLLSKGYGQDWRVGAEWFERCSLDYDPFINYHGFAYFSELIRDDFGERVVSASFIAHNADQTGIYCRTWLPQLVNVPSTYIHRVHVLTERMQKMHNVKLGQNYPYPIKLWEGAQETLGPTQLTAYFDSEKKINGAGFGEAYRFGTKLVPLSHLPLVATSTLQKYERMEKHAGVSTCS